MKKTTLKITAFLLLTMFAFQVQAQTGPWANTPGVYKLKVVGQDLYFTVNATTGILTWETLLPGDDVTQLFGINDHPAGSYHSITSVIPGRGVAEAVYTDAADVVPNLVCQGNAAAASGQQDQLNLGRNSGTGIFLESDKTGTPWENVSAKRRIQNEEVTKDVIFSGGTATVFEYVFVSTLSNEKFDTSSIFISNPVNNQLSIKGLVSDVKRVSVYSLLGQEILTSKVDGQSSLNLDVSALTSGVYIIKMIADNGSFTKKIIKE